MPKLILIAAGDIEVRDKLTLILSNEKYNLKVATDFEMSIKMIWASPPDIILLDLECPHVNAPHILAETQKIHPCVCVIGISSSDEIANDRHHGIKFVLSKPLSRPRVLSVITRCLAA